MKPFLEVIRSEHLDDIMVYEVPELKQRYVWNPAKQELTVGAIGRRFQPCEIWLNGNYAIRKHHQLELAHIDWLKFMLETLPVHLYALGYEGAGSLVEQALKSQQQGGGSHE